MLCMLEIYGFYHGVNIKDIHCVFTLLFTYSQPITYISMKSHRKVSILNSTLVGVQTLPIQKLYVDN